MVNSDFLYGHIEDGAHHHRHAIFDRHLADDVD